MRGRLILLLLCTGFLLNHGDGIAQTPFYKHFTINDGLISNKIYNIIEDRRGFIWLCTEQGVSRFDGISFLNFTVKDGLPDNEVLNIFEDDKGRIWFNGFSTEPCYYFEGKIYNSGTDPFLARVKKYKPNGMCLTAIVRSNNSIAFRIVEDNRMLLVGKEIEDIEIKIKGLEIVNLYQYILLRQNDSFELFSALEIVKWRKGDSVKNYRMQNENHKLNYTRAPDNFIYTYDYKGSKIDKYDIMNNRVTSFNTNIRYHEIFVNERFITLAGDRQYVIYDSDLSREKEHVEVPFTFERMHVDRHGNKWFSSFDKGLYFIRKNAPVKVQLPEGKEDGILSIVPDGDALYLNSEKNGLFCLHKSGNVEQVVYIPEMNRMKGYCRSGTEQVLGTDDGLYQLGKKYNEVKMLKHMAVKDIEPDVDNTLLLGMASIAAIYGLHGHDSLVILDFERTTAICRKNEHEVWLGGLNGIRMNKKTGAKYTTVDLKLHADIDNSRIVDIKRDRNGNMWVATDQKGLFLCPVNGDIVHFSETAKTGFKLISDVCQQIVVDKDNSIWLATRAGVSLIAYLDGSGRTFSVSNYSMPEGMPGKTINSIAFWQGRIYLTSTNGLFYFNAFPEPSNETSETIITGVIVNNTAYSPKTLHLPYNQNNLFISYASSFINTGMVYRFRYRIKELSVNWTETKTLELPLLGLESGTYTFEIAAINSHEDSGKVASLSFTIAAPWYKRWWFATLISVILLLILLYYYRLISERVSMVKKLALLQLRILRAQMNPHFVFNALSNIQHLIQVRKLEDAEDYIGTLSTIMRKSIDYSGKEFIQLDKEIEYTKQYLEIEKMRFREKFNFEFILLISEEEMRSVFVPPLILQPIVENAIKHGFRGIKYKGILTITVEKLNEEELRYQVKDNGCGFKFDPNLSDSHGLAITRDRLSILFKGDKRRAQLQISTSAEMPETGTLITVQLPVIKD